MATRIGDLTDDYCSRCHLLTDHTVSAMVGETIASVTCRTCAFTHDYRGGKTPARKPKKASSFDQVLAGILGSQPPAPEPPAKNKRKKK